MSSADIEGWAGTKIVVVGDVMLDRFIYGSVERVSPEAPIPVLRQQSERLMLGGAANVARNVVALGGRAALVGVVGADADGERIAGELCASDGIEGHLVRVDSHPTTVKTRLVSGAQQIVRLDVERVLAMDTTTEDRLFGAFETALANAAAVVLSDYAKGVLAPPLIARLVAAARARHVPVIVDPKTSDVRRFTGATALTPNALEARQISGRACQDDSDVEAAAEAILTLAGVDAVIVTRGAQGMTILDPRQAKDATHIRTVAREVFDVSGAGDTVVATLALALSTGASILESARLANAAAGIAVGKRGTAVVKARELSLALQGGERGSPKIMSVEAAAEMAADWRQHGLKVGFTNGCFDLLHPGHIELLRRARATCDRLIVALNTDASVKRLKGPSRPVQNETARSIVMAAIDSVDLVILFDEDTPIDAIEAIRPDRLIKGSDYTVATVVGADFVQSHGGEVVLVPIEAGHSTTSIIARSRTSAAMTKTTPRFRRWALLDRDGTIILDKSYLADPAGIEFAPGAIEGLKLLRDAGFGLILVTNQSGIGRGLFRESDFEAVQVRLVDLLATEGLALAATYHCPHAPGDGCACRKPKPGMLLRAMSEFAIPPDAVIMIGDSAADSDAAAAAGIRAIGIAPQGEQDGGAPDLAPDFLAAARRAVALVTPAAR